MQSNNIIPFNNEKSDFDLKDVELLINGGVDELEDAMNELTEKAKGSSQKIINFKRRIKKLKKLSLGLATAGTALAITTILVVKSKNKRRSLWIKN